jgi:ElaB/YqjD/DUF883 family membrane-anchored ribosome-binding protein
MIRQDIEETRQSLTEKLETLENQVMGTVQHARATVEETIDSVKSTVSETVDTVKRTFDLEYQVGQHPFMAAGLAFLGGAAIGVMVKGARHHRWQGPNGAHTLDGGKPVRHFRQPDGSVRQARDWATTSSSAESSAEEGGLLNRFGDEVDKVKGLAIGAAMGIVRDLAKDYLPKTLAPHVDEVLDSATRKLGGQPLEGRIISPA